ncbi:MAG: hypothetical protein RL189_2924 [Pseudomonadota bacterium]
MGVDQSDLQIAKTNPAALGGYIQFEGVFGEKACNATFDVVDVLEDQIKLRAYSASHCRLEHGVVDWDDPKTFPKTSLHFYFDRSTKRTAGYVKNIPAVEEFSDRTVQLAREAQRVSLPKDVYALFLGPLRTPTHVYSDDLQGDAEVPSFSYGAFAPTPNIYDQPREKPPNPEFNICNNPKMPNFNSDQIISFNESCWSVLDVGQFDLEIRKKDMSAIDFDFIAEQLSVKKKIKDNLLKKNPKLASLSMEQHRYFAQMRSELRMKNYAQLAYLLNFNHCAPVLAGSPESVRICKYQHQLIELVGKYLSETEVDGSRMNIFDRLAREKDFEKVGISFANLRSGQRFANDPSATTFDSVSQKSIRYSRDLRADSDFLILSGMRKMFERIRGTLKDTNKDNLSSEFYISTNIQLDNNLQKTEPSFAHFQLTQISRTPGSLMIAPNISATDESLFGITKEGILRFAVRRGEEKVKFSKTDSGSLVTISNLVPLMVLNTVDDGEPVSGGASILALPEAQSEDNSPADGTSGAGNSAKDSDAGKKNPRQFSSNCR